MKELEQQYANKKACEAKIALTCLIDCRITKLLTKSLVVLFAATRTTEQRIQATQPTCFWLSWLFLAVAVRAGTIFLACSVGTVAAPAVEQWERTAEDVA